MGLRNGCFEGWEEGIFVGCIDGFRDGCEEG